MGAGKKIAAAVVLGTIAGAIAGVLLAPKSGKETRANAKKFADDFKKNVAKETAKMSKITQKKYNEIVDMLAKDYEMAKKFKENELDDLIKDVKSRWKQVQKEVAKEEAKKKK